MNSKRLFVVPALAVAVATTASAQVQRFVGPSPNLTIALDFDSPFVPSGPITSMDMAFTSAGITSVTQIAVSGWIAQGDTLTGASNVNGQGLVSDNGIMDIGGPGEPLDSAGPGDGWEIQLAAPVQEFQVQFIDQLGMNYDVELFMGAMSLGVGNFTYNGTFPSPPDYWRAGGAMFDRVLITFPNGSFGVGLDEFAFGNGPGPMPPANDDCASATVAMLGANAFSNMNATPSALAMSCGLAAESTDVFMTYTAASTDDLRIDTCGSGFDTVIEVYSGTCAAPVSQGCNDDSPLCGGLQSSLTVSGVNVGDVFLIQIGGFNGAQGAGTLNIAEVAPPMFNCVANNGFETGDTSGWVLQDFAAPFIPAIVSGPGRDPGFGIFQSAPTEGAFSFTIGFDGQGPDVASLSQDVLVTAGTTPLTYDYRAGWDLITFGGGTLDRVFRTVVRDPMNNNVLQSVDVLTAMSQTQNFDTGPMNGSIDLSMFVGQTVNIAFEWDVPEAFTGPGFFELDNISCPSGGPGVGTNFCGPGTPNSSGNPGFMSASGTNVVANNDLVLEANDLSLNSFGFFITSVVQSFVPNPNGSLGNLCLGGAIGRYVGPGQIQNSGATGFISLAVDLNMHPTPTGLISVMPGDVWNFQLWHRDFVNGMVESNFTDGYSITFN